ncbi:uncharacterized protein LOC135819686 [Sycon ciliatum]|uniref:uncharacterized protein LOC135819686 n=1 Tax=Sycon ciliatum TaxID=27933 RepID=UPI0031F5FA79
MQGGILRGCEMIRLCTVLCVLSNTGNEDAANRVTRRQPARFTGNPPPSPSQATRSPPAIAPKPKPAVKHRATHASPPKPTGISAMIAAFNSAGQEQKLAGTQPSKPSLAPQPPTRPKPATPHNTARTVETKDPTTVHRVQPVLTSDPVSPSRPPLCDHTRLAAGGNQSMGTQAATSALADPKPSPKPRQAALFRSASVSTLASGFESDRYEAVRLPSDQAPKPKPRQIAITGARAASLARSPAIAVQQVQRSALPTEGLAAKPIALPTTGGLSIAKNATGDSATPPQPNSLGQAGNTGPWSGQVFRKWIPHLKAALSCGTIRTECLAEGLLTDPQKKELMGVEDDSAKHNDRLLDMLSRGTAETFHTFCSIVRSTEPEANFSKFLDDMQSVDTFVAGNEDAANRVTRRQPARFTGNPPPSPSQATRSPPAIAPKPKPAVKHRATHASPPKPTGISAIIAAFNSAGQEQKLAGTQPSKPSLAPQPPTRPKPATPHNTARTVETKDPTTVHRVQPVVTSDPVSPSRPPLCDHTRLAAGGNQSMGTQAATSALADPKPSPKPRQAAPFRSASVSTLASGFESDRYEAVRLPSDQAPKPKPRQIAITGARAASLARSPAIAVQQVQRSALPTEGLAAKPIALPTTGGLSIAKNATGDSATPPQPNSLGQAGNTGPWSGQVFRKWIPHLKAALSCGTIRTECLAEGLLTDPQKKELMGVEDDSAKHNDRLLDMLSRGTAETFHTFCSIVRSTEPEANFSKFLDDMQSVDTFVAVSPECKKDCNKVVDLMKEFSAPERQRVVHTAKNVARMRTSQTVLDKGKKPIHVPQPTSPKSVDLLRMQNMEDEKRQAALTEIDHLVSNTIIIDDTKDCADEAEKYQGHVTRADGQVEKSPADIHRELSKHPCFISMGTGSARDDRSISETKQYLKDTGFIDENTVITEITEYELVPVTRLAIRDSKRLKFKDQRSSIVKFIIECEYNHTAPSFIKSVIRNLRNLLGDWSIHADSVHGESGGTAVFVQMSARAHTRLWEFCKDRSSLLAGLHVLEVSTVDGAVVFNFRPTTCSGEGITPDDQKRLVEEFSKRYPSLDRDELSVAVADQQNVQHAVIALTKLVFDDDGACLNALPEIPRRVAARTATSTPAHVVHPEEAISTRVSANPGRAVEIQGADNELSLRPQFKSQWYFRGRVPSNWTMFRRCTMYNGHVYIVCQEEEEVPVIYRSTHSLKESIQLTWTRVIGIDSPPFWTCRRFCLHNEKLYFASLSYRDRNLDIPYIYVFDLQGNCCTREIQCDFISVPATGTDTSWTHCGDVFVTQSALLIVCLWRNHFLEVFSLDTRHDGAAWAKLDLLSLPEPPDSICSTDDTLFVIPRRDLNDVHLSTHLSIMKLDVSEESLRMPSWLEIKVDMMTLDVDVFSCVVSAAVGNSIIMPVYCMGDDFKTVNAFMCVDCSTCIGRCSVFPPRSSKSFSPQLMVDGDTLIALHSDHSVSTLQLPDHL